MAFRFETTNERWQHFLADVDPFLDPSELENPEASGQHQQNYAELKQQVSELYNSFMSDKISAEMFANKLQDVVRAYVNKPIQY